MTIPLVGHQVQVWWRVPNGESRTLEPTPSSHFWFACSFSGRALGFDTCNGARAQGRKGARVLLKLFQYRERPNSPSDNAKSHTVPNPPACSRTSPGLACNLTSRRVYTSMYRACSLLPYVPDPFTVTRQAQTTSKIEAPHSLLHISMLQIGHMPIH